MRRVWSDVLAALTYAKSEKGSQSLKNDAAVMLLVATLAS